MAAEIITRRRAIAASVPSRRLQRRSCNPGTVSGVQSVGGGVETLDRRVIRGALNGGGPGLTGRTRDGSIVLRLGATE